MSEDDNAQHAAHARTFVALVTALLADDVDSFNMLFPTSPVDLLALAGIGVGAMHGVVTALAREAGQDPKVTWQQCCPGILADLG